MNKSGTYSESVGMTAAKRWRIVKPGDEYDETQEVLIVAPSKKDKLANRSKVYDKWIKATGLANWMSEAGIPCYWELVEQSTQSEEIKEAKDDSPAQAKRTRKNDPKPGMSSGAYLQAGNSRNDAGVDPSIDANPTKTTASQSRHVTASSAKMETMVKYYRWRFLDKPANFDQLLPHHDLRSALPVLRAIEKDIKICSGKDAKIPIPRHWKGATPESFVQKTVEALKAWKNPAQATLPLPVIDHALITLLVGFEKMLEELSDLLIFETINGKGDNQKKEVETEEQDRDAGQTEQNTNPLKYDEIWPTHRLNCEFHTAYRPETAMHNFLQMPAQTQTGAETEIPVERDIGSRLQALSEVSGCKTSGGAKLEYPPGLKPLGSDAIPDSFSRHGAKASLLTIVPLLGEAKTKADKKKKDVYAQLCFAAQPTLQLMAIHLTLLWRTADGKSWKADCNPLAKSNKDRPSVPEHMRVHAFLYDRESFEVLCYFPFYTVEADKVVWHFQWVKIYEVNYWSEKNPSPTPVMCLMKMLRAVLVAKQGAEKLVREVEAKPMLMPEELLDMERLWNGNLVILEQVGNVKMEKDQRNAEEESELLAAKVTRPNTRSKGKGRELASVKTDTGKGEPKATGIEKQMGKLGLEDKK